ncbi:MAG: hypothetical protein KAV42_09250 [Candidatus Krumholzibacteria bacterium]|nr:hypothetical protein [Candidatus Krumholzibacteria bacterium]
MRTRITISVILALVLISSSTVHAQIIYGQPGSAGLKFYYSSWNLEDQDGLTQDISQGTLDLSGFIPLKENLEARYQILSGFNTLEYGDAEDDLSGLGDLRIQISRSFSRDKYLLSAGVNLPTGSRELNAEEERRIVEFLSYDFLTLPMRRFGEGLGFNIQAGAATELGRFKCGLSAVYDFLGSYSPYEETGDYDPGDAISVNATANTMSGKVSYTGNFGFSIFGTDALEDDDIYKQAPQFNARIMAVIPGQKYTTTIGTRLVIRGRNKRYSLTEGVIDSQLKKYGDEIGGFVRLSFTGWKAWNIGTMAGIRQIMANEEEFDASTVFNLGLDLSKAINDRLTFDTGMIYYTGSADGGEIDMSGFQMSGGISLSY